MPGDSGVLVVTRVRSTTTTCTRNRGCSGHPAFPTPSRGRKIYQRLGRSAPRGRERVSGVVLLFEDFEIGVCAKRYLTSRHKTHPSCPDLIRASINLRGNFFRRRWITGSSPVMTISIGMTVTARSQRVRPSAGPMINSATKQSYSVIPGRCEASNPESRDSPMRNCASEVWSCGPSRNDGA